MRTRYLKRVLKRVRERRVSHSMTSLRLPMARLISVMWLTRVVKDIIPRYRTMKGYNVLRKAGWDTHGLPVELEVEKELGISSKDQIEEYGLEPFINKCKESVWKYKGMWENSPV